jgi:hypothetical protein
MQADFLAPPRQARTRLIAAVAAGLVVLAAVVVLATRARSAEPDRQASAGQAPAAPAATATTTSPSASATAAAADRVRLIEGARHVNDVAVGYPHTMAGAVSAAVEYTTDLGSTLDFKRAQQIGAAATDPGSGRSAAFYAQGVATNRKGMGLPVSGDVPTGASLSVGPVSYQLRDASGDRVTVLLLSYLTWITPAKGMHNVVIVVPVAMTWAKGDWKLSGRPAGAPDYAELRYQPGSTEAVTAGWLPLTA